MIDHYFQNLQTLLDIERKEDHQNYLRLTQNTGAADRRMLGLSWYPIAIRNTEIGRGDYVTIEIERTTHYELKHQFRFGAAVVLFSNHDPKNNRLDGVVSHQSRDRMKIALRVDELPDWTRDGKLGVDLLFDNNSYDEMFSALKQASEQLEEDSLIKVLVNQLNPSFQDLLPSVKPAILNLSQQLAVDKILEAKDLCIVHGPPGTGKTTTLIAAIQALVKHENQKILVVAPSNTAVDLLTEKLAEQGLDVVRVGNPARVSERLMSSTLEHKMMAHPEMKQVKLLRKQASEYKSMAHKYKRSFGKAERDQRKALFDEAHKIIKEVDRSEQYIAERIFDKAQIITAKLVGSNHYTIKNLKYHTVVIDEAGQALEPACWIPILKAQKVILAGDHCQLPPTIKSNEAATKGLNKTLMEKLVHLYPQAVILLEEQYRMNTSIMGYSSKMFYGGRLKANASVANRLMFEGDEPLTFLDTSGCGFDEKQEGTSTVNPEEAGFLLNHLTQYLENNANLFDRFPSIAIISPYKQQVELLNELVKSNDSLKAYQDNISINTVDSFQGQERDIIYIGLTRSNTESSIGFLSDTRRMNVAMTRARKKLVVIGDGATLAKSDFYSGFIEYADFLGYYHSAWEFIHV